MVTVKHGQKNVPIGDRRAGMVTRSISAKKRLRYIAASTTRPPRWAYSKITRALNWWLGINGQTRPQGKLYEIRILGGWWFHLSIFQSGTSGVRLFRLLRLNYAQNGRPHRQKYGYFV